MSMFLVTTPDQINKTSDPDIMELLKEANEYCCREKIFVSERMNYKTKFSIHRGFYKYEYPVFEMLIADTDPPVWDMQCVTAAGSTKESIIGWLYGFINGVIEQKRKNKQLAEQRRKDRQLATDLYLSYVNKDEENPHPFEVLAIEEYEKEFNIKNPYSFPEETDFFKKT
jgi:hypothetical protein